MAHYSDELLEEVRSRNDIVDIISQYVTLKRKGRNFFGLCPFHNEKSPSFSVSPDKQIFKCFGCGKGGNVFHFLMNAENISFVEAVQILAERANIELPKNSGDEDEKQVQLKNEVYKVNEAAAMFYHETLYKPTSKIAQEYVKKRKLGNNTLKAFLIGYAPMNNELFNHLKSKGFSYEAMLASNLIGRSEKGIYYDKFKHRLMIPIQDVRNRYIAFGGRVLDDSKPKYINSPEDIVYSKGRNLFGLNVAKRNSNGMLKEYNASLEENEGESKIDPIIMDLTTKKKDEYCLDISSKNPVSVNDGLLKFYDNEAKISVIQDLKNKFNNKEST